ncbi:MAG: hypothetical protein KQH83_05175 [Actinobacteria bacterium]|nr:hypothetical protein [Actinomycetota bacterium]
MLSILMAAAALPAFAWRRRYPSGISVPLSKLAAIDGDVELDLPCPWCHGPTAEIDAACPSCGRRFGA